MPTGAPTTAPTETAPPPSTAPDAPTQRPTAGPIPTPTIDPGVTLDGGYTVDQLAAMVLTGPEVEAVVAGLTRDAGGGIVDNGQAAEDTFDPADSGETLEAAGRIVGFQSRFQDLTAILAREQRAAVVASAVDVFATAQRARDFLEARVADLGLAGTTVDGISLDEVIERDAPSVGDDSTAAALRTTAAGIPDRLATEYVAWARGTLVAQIRIVSVEGPEFAVEAERLSRVMDQRIDGVESGVIAPVEPTAAPPPTPTPLLGSEASALAQGFDLAAMAFAPADLPDGFVLIENSYLAEGPIVFNQQIEPPGFAAMFGSSEVGRIDLQIELHPSTLEAALPISLLQSLSTDALRGIFSTVLAQAEEEPPQVGEVTIEALDIEDVGDAIVGFALSFTSEDEQAEAQFVVFSIGRVKAQLVVIGPDLDAAHTGTLVQTIAERITENSPEA